MCIPGKVHPHSQWGTFSFPVSMCISSEAHPHSQRGGVLPRKKHRHSRWGCAFPVSLGMHKVYADCRHKMTNQSLSIGKKTTENEKKIILSLRLTRFSFTYTIWSAITLNANFSIKIQRYSHSKLGTFLDTWSKHLVWCFLHIYCHLSCLWKSQERSWSTFKVTNR